jgi:hypothetical protein
MNKPNMTVVQTTDVFPSGIKSASDISESVGISPERLVELADSGYIPHYRIDGGPPLFKQSEVRQWVANNLIARVEGREFPRALNIVLPAPEIVDRPPAAIQNLPNLQQPPKWGFQPGVYFLCKGDEVVYVGQSVAPAGRIATHAQNPYKDFDRVYLLPVPESELNDVEGAFIRHLEPSQQGRVKDGGKLTAPRISCHKDRILEGVGLSL